MSKRKKLSADFNDQIKLEIGQSFSGVFLECREIQVDGETRLIYTFKQGENEVDMWGSGQLNQYMKKIKPGTMTYIKRVADVPSPTFKGAMMKAFEVEIED